MSRRGLLLTVTLVGGVALFAGPAAVATTTDDSVSVLLVTVDGLDPDELDEAGDDGAPLAPNMLALRDAGTSWTQARAIMSAETLPNHVAMQTGTYAGFHGLPGNDGRFSFGDTENSAPDLGVIEAREATSVLQAINEQCPELRTVASLSKEYVYTTFLGEADEEFDQPSFEVPQSGHAPDSTTVPFVVDALAAGPIDHVFLNMGDHDRASHIDTTGANADLEGNVTEGERAGQRAALSQADAWVGELVTALQDSGEWERTVLLLASDHSFTFTPAVDPRFTVDVLAELEAVETDLGREPGSTFFGATNGATMFVYLTDPEASDADDVLAQAWEVVRGLDGVDEVLYRLPNPADPDGPALSTEHPDWNMHQTHRSGELFVSAVDGYRLGSPDSVTGQAPGVHGSIESRHSTAIVAGGWDGIVGAQVIDVDDPSLIDHASDTELFPEQVENVDWAPTIAWLLGVEDPGTAAGGDPQWRGRVLEEAFTRRPADLPCAAAAGGAGTGSGPGGEDDGDDDGSLAATGGGLAVVGLLLLASGATVRRRNGPGAAA